MFSRISFAFVGCLALAAVASAQVATTPSAPTTLPIEPLRDSGMNVNPAFEGWYQNADGSYNLLLGYYNRNMKEAIEVPIGPNNKIEPGGPDQGQPTYFPAVPNRRGWGVISIKVPKDFGDKKITWTLTSNGKTVSIPFGIVKGYQIEPMKDAAMGNTPPVIKFSETGAALQGPPGPLSSYPTIEATVGTPVAITFWITDDGNDEPPAAGAPPPPPAANPRAARPRVSTTLTKYRGPAGQLPKFENTKPAPDASGKATTMATFPAAGDWIIRIEGNDSSGVGGGGFQCCWTTAYLKVNVKGAGTAGGK